MGVASGMTGNDHGKVVIIKPMRTILRSIIFSFVGVLAISRFFDGFLIEGSDSKVFFLISFGMGLIGLFSKPLLKIMSLPVEGVLSIILSFFINIVSFFALDYFVSGFQISAGRFVSPTLVGFPLGSYDLSIFWGYVLIAATFTIVVGFLQWLLVSKK